MSATIVLKRSSGRSPPVLKLAHRQGWGWFDYLRYAKPNEVKQAIARIEHLLVTNEFSDRVYDLRDGDTKTVRNLLAYRKVGVGGGTEEFWVPTVFDKEFVVGVNKAELVKELQRLGWLLPPRPDGKAIHTRSVCRKRIYFYIFGNGKKTSELPDLFLKKCFFR